MNLRGRALWKLDKLKCRLFGHRFPFDSHNLGIDVENPGWVDFYCTRCEKKISTQPIMEVTDEETLSIIQDLEGGYGPAEAWEQWTRPPDA